MASPIQHSWRSGAAALHDVAAVRAHPRPEWLKVRFFGGENYQELKRIMRTLDLHTVCESARCPNQGECWDHRTATFMILGDVCTANLRLLRGDLRPTCSARRIRPNRNAWPPPSSAWACVMLWSRP